MTNSSLFFIPTVSVKCLNNEIYKWSVFNWNIDQCLAYLSIEIMSAPDWLMSLGPVPLYPSGISPLSIGHLVVLCSVLLKQFRWHSMDKAKRNTSLHGLISQHAVIYVHSTGTLATKSQLHRKTQQRSHQVVHDHASLPNILPSVNNVKLRWAGNSHLPINASHMSNIWNQLVPASIQKQSITFSYD